MDWDRDFDETASRASLRRPSLQVSSLPRPGKTTQGEDWRRPSAVKKSFGGVRNFWRQLEGGGPEPNRVYNRRPRAGRASQEEVRLRPVQPPRRRSADDTRRTAKKPVKRLTPIPEGEDEEPKQKKSSGAKDPAKPPSRKHTAGEEEDGGQESPDGSDEESSEEEPSHQDESPGSESAVEERGDAKPTEGEERAPSGDQGQQPQAEQKMPKVLRSFSALRRTRLGSRASRYSSSSLGGLGSRPPPGPPPPPPPPPPPGLLTVPQAADPGAVTKIDQVTLRRATVLIPHLLEEEKEFLDMVASGNIMKIQDFLEERPDFNINCSNYQGVTALQLAVQAGDLDMVDFLLADPLIEVNDAHLFAIRENKPEMVKLLLDKLQMINPGLEFMACSNSAEFPESVTPLILAAEAGHYDIIKILLHRGHVIPVPHHPKCFCKEECQLIMRTQDPLSVSAGKLHIYRALSNPAYICQTSDDPILTAFKLSAELKVCGEVEVVYLRQYESLAEAVRNFAMDLVSECRSLEEVEGLLSERTGSNLKTYSNPRLILAVDMKQKEFVAHPNVQLYLDRIWYGDWLAWKRYGKMKKAFIPMQRIFMLPVVFCVMMFTPTSSWAKHYSMPINKLISSIASYCVFLFLVFVQSNVDKVKQTRDSKPTGVELFLVIYVITYICNSMRSLILEGPKRFFSLMWNMYQVTMEALFVLAFYFWIYAEIRTTVTGDTDLERKYWHYLDAELIAEGLYVVAAIMAYMRILFILQMSYDLGPLQVSLGKMAKDFALYAVIFAIIFLAFTVGLCKFYSYYEGMYIKSEETGEIDSKQENSFTSPLDTFKTLFWGIFGMSSYEVADVVIEPIKDDEGNETINEHHFTEAIGYLVFAVFMILVVVVILNMLIATMSNTFQTVYDNVDMEWAFGRTEARLSFLNHPILPPPFNVIPTTRGLVSLLRRGKGKEAPKKSAVDAEKGLMAESKPEEYHVLISQIVQRYFSTKKDD